MSLHLDSVQIIRSAQLTRIECSVQAASAAWLLYDYILTLPDELRCIWWRPFSSVKILFIIMRYIALASLLRSFQNFVDWHRLPDGGASACQVIWKLDTAIGAIFYTCFAVFMALRIYAVSGRSIKALLSVLCLSMVFVCCTGFDNIIGTALPRPWFSGCYQSYVLGGHLGETDGDEKVPNIAYGIIDISGMCCFFIAEAIVQVYTWRSTWKVVQALDKVGTKKSLSYLLLRDGTIAWITVSIWAIICGAVTSVELTSFSIPCMTIVGCRVIMRLRQTELSDSMDHPSGTKSWLSARFIGNVGAPLDFSDHQEHHNDEEDDDVVDYVHGNRLAAGLEDARLEDHGCV